MGLNIECVPGRSTSEASILFGEEMLVEWVLDISASRNSEECLISRHIK